MANDSNIDMSVAKNVEEFAKQLHDRLPHTGNPYHFYHHYMAFVLLLFRFILLLPVIIRTLSHHRKNAWWLSENAVWATRNITWIFQLTWEIEGGRRLILDFTIGIILPMIFLRFSWLRPDYQFGWKSWRETPPLYALAFFLFLGFFIFWDLQRIVRLRRAIVSLDKTLELFSKKKKMIALGRKITSKLALYASQAETGGLGSRIRGRVAKAIMKKGHSHVVGKAGEAFRKQPVTSRVTFTTCKQLAPTIFLRILVFLHAPTEWLIVVTTTFSVSIIRLSGILNWPRIRPVVDFFNKLDVVTEIEQQTSGNIGYVQLSEFTKSANVMAMVGDPQELLNDLSDDLNDDFADIRQTAASIAHAASYAAANANTIAHNAAANANVIAHNAAANANTIAHDAAANVSTIVTAANVSSIAINASTIATTTATNAGSFIASSTSATVVNLANIATNTGSFTSETVGNLTNIVRSSLGSKEKTS